MLHHCDVGTGLRAIPCAETYLINVIGASAKWITCVVTEPNNRPSMALRPRDLSYCILGNVGELVDWELNIPETLVCDNPKSKTTMILGQVDRPGSAWLRL